MRSMNEQWAVGLLVGLILAMSACGGSPGRMSKGQEPSGVEPQRLAVASPSAQLVKDEGPSYACNKLQGDSIEQLICEDRALSMLDRTLAEVYAAAAKKAVNEHPPVLKAEQRGWIKARDECWKSADSRRCVEEQYKLRIAELQARYRLLPSTGPVTYACDGDPRNEIIVSFFQTQPPTAVGERGDSVSLMYLQRTGSGAKYLGRNETFWEHQGEALVTWGHGSAVMHCKKMR